MFNSVYYLPLLQYEIEQQFLRENDFWTTCFKYAVQLIEKQLLK